MYSRRAIRGRGNAVAMLGQRLEAAAEREFTLGLQEHGRSVSIYVSANVYFSEGSYKPAASPSKKSTTCRQAPDASPLDDDEAPPQARRQLCDQRAVGIDEHGLARAGEHVEIGERIAVGDIPGCAHAAQTQLMRLLETDVVQLDARTEAAGLEPRGHELDLGEAKPVEDGARQRLLASGHDDHARTAMAMRVERIERGSREASRIACERGAEILREATIARQRNAEQGQVHEKPQRTPTRPAQQHEGRRGQQQRRCEHDAPPLALAVVAQECGERIALEQHAVEIEKHDSCGRFPGRSGHYENNRRNSAPGSCARMNVSPTRNACTSAARILATSSRVTMPLSVTSRRSAGTRLRRFSVVSSEVSNVRRLRLLMPIRRAGVASARSSSSPSCTSTSTSMPSSPASSASSTKAASPSAATISRMQSAPSARAS